MNKQSLWQMVKYAIFSVSAGVIQTGSFALLYNVIFAEQAKMYSLCYVVALVLSILWNFTLNRKYTFKAVVNVPVAMLKVACFYIVFTPTSMWLGQLAVNGGWNGLLVEVLTMCANFVLEFLFFKFVVFRGKDEKTEK